MIDLAMYVRENKDEITNIAEEVLRENLEGNERIKYCLSAKQNLESEFEIWGRNESEEHADRIRNIISDFSISCKNLGEDEKSNMLLKMSKQIELELDIIIADLVAQEENICMV